MKKTKSFDISKQLFVQAFKHVKANAGAAGIDQQSLEDFERNLKDNLYKLWNRMSSGSYFPPAVKAVPIPKKSGGERILGVPTVTDRIAQMVVKLLFEPCVEPYFLSDYLWLAFVMFTDVSTVFRTNNQPKHILQCVNPQF